MQEEAVDGISRAGEEDVDGEQVQAGNKDDPGVKPQCQADRMLVEYEGEMRRAL